MLVERNKKADRSHLGVALGRKCIARNIPVTYISSQFGVSRMTIYNWFVGQHLPQAKYASAIAEFLKKLK